MGIIEGKVAIVTGGGGSGIGHGISVELAREGAFVVIVEKAFERGKSICRQIDSDGGKAIALNGDVGKRSEVQKAVHEVVRKYHRIDILVNSAGVGLARPLAEATEAEFDELMAVDFRGTWLCCKYTIPHMQKQRAGVIVNISSVHSRATLPSFGLYAAMKAGVSGLTRGIAVEYGADGIRANAICPALVDGKQNRDLLSHIHGSDMERWLAEFPRRHLALPYLLRAEDIGRVVAFLASDAARGITGAEIPVDAGLLARLRSED